MCMGRKETAFRNSGDIGSKEENKVQSVHTSLLETNVYIPRLANIR